MEADDNYCSALVDEYPDVHYTNILAVSFAPKTNVVATSSVDKTVKVSTMFATDKDISQRNYRHHQAPVLSIDFHPVFPNLMLTTSMDGASVLVDTSFEPDFGEDLETAGVIQQFKDHQKYIVRGVFSLKDGKYFATASYDRTIAIYETNEEENGLPKYTLLRKLGPYIGNVETICFINENTLVAGVRNDNYLHYISLPEMNQSRVNMNATGDDWVSFSPAWISLSPSGDQLLCTTDHTSGRTILFALGESRQLQNYYIHPTDNEFTTRRHIWDPSGRYFYAIGDDDNSIAVIETKSGRTVDSLKGHAAMVKSLASFSNKLVSVGYDHTIKVWSQQEK